MNTTTLDRLNKEFPEYKWEKRTSSDTGRAVVMCGGNVLKKLLWRESDDPEIQEVNRLHGITDANKFVLEAFIVEVRKALYEQ